MYNRIQPKPSTKEWRPWNSFLNKIVPTTNPDQVYYPDLEPTHPYNQVDSENEVKPDRSLMASKWAVKPESPELLNNYDMGYVSWRAVEPETPEPAITEDVNYVSLKGLGIFVSSNERMKEHTNIKSSNDSVERYQVLRYSRDEMMKIDSTVNTSWICSKTIDMVNNNLLEANVFFVSPKRDPKGPVYSTNFIDRRRK